MPLLLFSHIYVKQIRFDAYPGNFLPGFFQNVSLAGIKRNFYAMGTKSEE